MTTAIRAKHNLGDAIRGVTMGCVSNGLYRQVLLPQEHSHAGWVAVHMFFGWAGGLNVHVLVG